MWQHITGGAEYTVMFQNTPVDPWFSLNPPRAAYPCPLTPRISLWPHNHSRPRNPRHTATCTKSFFRHLRRGLCPPTSFSPRPLPKLRPFGFLLSLPRAFLPPLVRRSVLPASLLAVQSSALNPLPLPLRPVLRGGWNPLLVRILSRSAPTCLRCSEKTPLPAPRSGAGVVHKF